MKHYTDTIPVTLAEELKEKGMPMLTSVSIDIVGGKNVVGEAEDQWYCPTYAEVFDWLMDKNINIYLDSDNGLWSWFIESDCALKRTEDYPSWHEASNAAIKEALELM